MGLFTDAASAISHNPGSGQHRSHSHVRSHHSSSKDKRRSGGGGAFSIRSGRSRSRSRARSPGARAIAASIFGLGGGGGGGGDDSNEKHRYHHQRHSSHPHEKRSSGFFGLPNMSTRSFFGGDKHRASTSHYRRSPRPSFLARAYRQLKRLFRDLASYAQRHPLKVVTLVVLPLLTGGVLTALLARFGLRLPPSLERLLGLGARVIGGGGGVGLGTVGLVGEAVRIASSGMGSGGGRADVRVERGRDGGMQWERKTWKREGNLDNGWGAGLMKSASRFFN